MADPKVEQLCTTCDALRERAERAEQRAADLEADLRLNAQMLARQTDLARQAETSAMRAEAEVKRLKVLIGWKHGALWDLSTAQWIALMRLAGAADLIELGRLWRTAESEGIALVREEADHET